MLKNSGPANASHAPARRIERENVVGEEFGAVGHQMGCGRGLAGARSRRDPDHMILDANGAGVKQVESLHRRRDRKRLREQQPVQGPGRAVVLGQQHRGAVGAHDVHPEVRCLDPVADPGILVDGDHDAPVRLTTFEDPPRLAGLPALGDLRCGEDLELDGARTARQRRFGRCWRPSSPDTSRP